MKKQQSFIPETADVSDVSQPSMLATRKLAAPLKWHGGKSYQAKHIIQLMPPHTHYCEPFAGGLAVLLAKNPDEIGEAVNDLNGELINFWRGLRDPDAFEQIHRRVEATPLSQVFFDEAGEPTSDPVERAVRFFIRARQSRQALGKDYCTPTTRTRRGMNEQVSAWLTAVEGLPEVHGRLKRVEIRNLPAVDFIRKYDHENCLFYCDPPYLHETRTAKRVYAYEMTEQDHRELLDCLARITGKFILSGYPSELYDRWAEQHGFHRIEIQIDNKSSSKKEKETKTEVLWMNYKP